jgi:hypothetical protein
MIYIAGALSSPFRDENKNINPTIELIAFALGKSDERNERLGISV